MSFHCFKPPGVWPFVRQSWEMNTPLCISHDDSLEYRWWRTQRQMKKKVCQATLRTQLRQESRRHDDGMSGLGEGLFHLQLRNQMRGIF